MKLAKKNCEVSSHFLELVLRNPGEGGRREMRTSLHLFPFLFYVSCTRGIAERPFSKAVFSLSFDLVFFSSSKFHFSSRFFSVSRDRGGGLLLFLGEGSREMEVMETCATRSEVRSQLPYICSLSRELSLDADTDTSPPDLKNTFQGRGVKQQCYQHKHDCQSTFPQVKKHEIYIQKKLRMASVSFRGTFYTF